MYASRRVSEILYMIHNKTAVALHMHDDFMKTPNPDGERCAMSIVLRSVLI